MTRNLRPAAARIPARAIAGVASPADRARCRIARQPIAGILVGGGVVHIGQHLVAADIEGAERNRPPACLLQHALIKRDLLRHRRKSLAQHELQLGAEETDTPGGGLFEIRQIDEQAAVQQQIDMGAVLAFCRQIAQRRILLALTKLHRDAIGNRLLHVFVRAQHHRTFIAVDDDDVTGFDPAQHVLRTPDNRNVERARDHRDMRIGRAFFEHQALEAFPIVIEQLGRPHIARDQDELVRQVDDRRAGRMAGKVPLQAIGQVFEVGQALAQIRVGRLVEAHAHIALHLLHRRFGGEAAFDRLGDTLHPALIRREHAIGLEDVAMLAIAGDIRCFEQRIDRAMHAVDCVLQALQLGSTVFGDDVTNDQQRLVQHGLADGEAGIEPRAFEPQRQLTDAGGLLPLQRIDQLARRRQLGQHHGNGLQDLDLVVVVLARLAILHHQHAEHAARTQDRHAHQRVIDLFAGLGPISEIGMGLGVGQRQRPRRGGDDADETFADPQPRAMDGFGPQTFGGEEFEHFAGAHDVTGAHFGDHVGRDDADDGGQSFLRGPLPRHHVAEPAKDEARGGNLLDHFAASLSGGGSASATPSRAAWARAIWVRAPSAATASLTNSSSMSCVDCSRVTKPTLCPAISEPRSTSPSITARRSAPAQKCSISSCASSRDSAPWMKRSTTLR